MQPQTRAVVAASAHALIMGKKVTGLYDYTAQRHLRIAAEARGEHLQGYDGERGLRFGGTLPELHSGAAAVHLQIEGTTVRGYDRSTSSHFNVEVSDRLVQLYDHADGAWFSFDVQVA